MNRQSSESLFQEYHDNFRTAGRLKSLSDRFYSEEIVAVNLTIFYYGASLFSAAEIRMH